MRRRGLGACSWLRAPTGKEERQFNCNGPLYRSIRERAPSTNAKSIASHGRAHNTSHTTREMPRTGEFSSGAKASGAKADQPPPGHVGTYRHAPAKGPTSTTTPAKHSKSLERVALGRILHIILECMRGGIYRHGPKPTGPLSQLAGPPPKAMPRNMQESQRKSKHVVEAWRQGPRTLNIMIVLAPKSLSQQCADELRPRLSQTVAPRNATMTNTPHMHTHTQMCRQTPAQERVRATRHEYTRKERAVCLAIPMSLGRDARKCATPRHKVGERR